MKRIRLFKLWRLFLPFLFIIFLIHFLKDITQDIFKIKTPLDILGNVNEDLRLLPKSIQNTFYFVGVGSFLGEIFLLFTIPVILKRKYFSKLEFVIIIIIVLILLYFFTSIVLDPKIIYSLQGLTLQTIKFTYLTIWRR